MWPGSPTRTGALIGSLCSMAAEGNGTSHIVASSPVASVLENQAGLHGLYNLASEVILLAGTVISPSRFMLKGHRLHLSL